MTTENKAPEGAQLPEPHGMKWRNKQTGATGVYFEDPRQFGINTEHPDYEWTPIYTADQLRAALAAPAPQAPAWQPIETAPKDGRLILVNFGCKGVRAVSWGSPFHDDVTEENGLWCVDDDKHGPFPLRGYCAAGPTAPTHWMPLPAAPQTKEPTNDR